MRGRISEDYWAIAFGWHRGPYTNASAGCAIILKYRLFAPQHVVQVGYPPAEVAGRGGFVRLKNCRGDFTLSVQYSPPIAGKAGKRAANIKAARMVNTWAQDLLSALPVRTLVLHGGDLNSGLGLFANGTAWERGIGDSNLGHGTATSPEKAFHACRAGA